MGDRVATMSVVVRADGVSEAFYNGQRDRVVEAVRAEAAERIKQAQADVERERARADRENLKRLSEELNRKRGFKDWITYTWAIVWTMASAAVLMVWIYLWLILYALKLVEYDWDYEPGDD